MPSQKSTTPKPKKRRQQKAAPLSVVVEEGYWSPPTPEEWESLRWFQARIRAALARKYPRTTEEGKTA